jgi:hypothetical protein
VQTLVSNKKSFATTGHELIAKNTQKREFLDEMNLVVELYSEFAHLDHGMGHLPDENTSLTFRHPLEENLLDIKAFDSPALKLVLKKSHCQRSNGIHRACFYFVKTGTVDGQQMCAGTLNYASPSCHYIGFIAP